MRLKELDDYSEEQYIDEYELFKEQYREYRLWLEQKSIYISEYNIRIRAGIYEAWDIESQDYEIDHSFYMIFDANTDEYLYSEAGSSMFVSLYNFLVLDKCATLSYNEVLDLSCEINVDTYAISF